MKEKEEGKRTTIYVSKDTKHKLSKLPIEDTDIDEEGFNLSRRISFIVRDFNYFCERTWDDILESGIDHSLIYEISTALELYSMPKGGYKDYLSNTIVDQYINFTRIYSLDEIESNIKELSEFEYYVWIKKIVEYNNWIANHEIEHEYKASKFNEKELELFRIDIKKSKGENTIKIPVKFYVNEDLSAGLTSLNYPITDEAQESLIEECSCVRRVNDEIIEIVKPEHYFYSNNLVKEIMVAHLGSFPNELICLDLGDYCVLSHQLPYEFIIDITSPLEFYYIVNSSQNIISKNTDTIKEDKDGNEMFSLVSKLELVQIDEDITYVTKGGEGDLTVEYFD